MRIPTNPLVTMCKLFRWYARLLTEKAMIPAGFANCITARWQQVMNL